ncbi:MAG TPA: glucoamylase family protein, partial [Anaerolineae bacterium]
EEVFGLAYLYAGPLFIHQLSHVWIDFRDIQDEYMRAKGIDYFENCRRATYAQQEYAIRNPQEFAGYHEFAWGITASDGPGDVTKVVDGVERRFYGYMARTIPPDRPDDGTLSPWASIASLPFAPEIVLPTIRYFNENYPEMVSELGFKCSFNPTFPAGESGWIADGYYGLDQGPIVIMIENYLTEIVWRLMRRCPYIVTGLRRAGFRGGWLDEEIGEE